MTEQKVKGILEEINNYEQSLNACLSFIHIYKWDEKEGKPDNNILYWIGKAYNPGKITPDITMQLSIDKGLVVELKPFLPINEEGHIDKWNQFMHISIGIVVFSYLLFMGAGLLIESAHKKYVPSESLKSSQKSGIV